MNEALPLICAETASAAGGITLRLFVPVDLSLFAGHFPGFPLLPGVAQIHWAARLGGERFSIDGGFSRLINIKFQKPVRPDSELELSLNWDAGRQQLAFTYASEAGCHTSGKIEFAAAGEGGGA
jgi:3-hydroxymyristoyl/3-hydroxydecanoyl-(acyl carrier protein) dehydratase